MPSSWLRLPPNSCAQPDVAPNFESHSWGRDWSGFGQLAPMLKGGPGHAGDADVMPAELKGTFVTSAH